MDPATRRDTTRNTTFRYASGYPAVANNVVAMTTSPGGGTRPAHLVHDELATPAEMAADCQETGRNLRLEAHLERAARAAVTTPPSLAFEDYPAEVTKREIRISEAAARLAGALHLHLD